MIDPKLLRQDATEIARRLLRKNYRLDLDKYRDLEDRRKHLDIESQRLQSERKQASKHIGDLVRGGMEVQQAKLTVNSVLEDISQSLDKISLQSDDVHSALDLLLSGIPNIPDETVPKGDSEDDNVEILRWGEPPQFQFEARDHVDLGAVSGDLDFELGTKLAGARFVVIRGALARLHRALIQFMLDVHTLENAYQEVNVPYIVNATTLYGTGQLPKFGEDLFRLDTDSNYYLIPTAEVPVTNIYRDRIIEDASELPVRLVCHSPCFRSEAGSYGKDQRGMIRQHQFEKVELVQLVRSDQSEAALEQLTGHAEGILRSLKLPYRKVVLCGGDLGFSARKTYDLEVWLPGQGRYREISSCSNMSDFQARRMQARWRNPATGRPELLHTVNGSGLAIGRTLIAIMENYQREDSSIEVPSVLQSYLGGIRSI